MLPSNAMAANGISLLGLMIGATVSFFSWDFGAPMILAALAVACIARYRYPSTGFSGSLAVISAMIFSIYAFGVIDREVAVFNINVSATVLTIILVGAIALVLGLLMGGGSKRSEPILGECSFAGVGIFFWVGVGGLAIALVNYVTGDIPLLAGDVNGARFGGNYGILGRLWPLVLPVGQVSIVIFLLMMRMRRLELKWTVLGIGSLISLVLSGSRAFVVIALIAFGVIYLDLKRPKIIAVFIAAFGGLTAFGLVGQVRALASSDASGYLKYMSKKGLDNWFGSTDLSLQTGPRVMMLAIDRTNGEPLGGRILFGDIGNFLNSAIPRSDRLVTVILGRDPVAGGYPPTLFGGLFLDFGWLGVTVGALFVGFLLSTSRRLMYRSPSLSTFVWFGYLASYITVSVYSYASFRPSWMVVLVLCYAAQFFKREANGASTARLKVSEVPGRGRTSRL